MFFDRFRELCDKKGVSPKRAATEMGLSNSLTTAWKKRGLTPSTETLGKIAEYFEVTVDYLLGLEKEKAPGQMTEREKRISEMVSLFSEMSPDVQEMLLKQAEMMLAGQKVQRRRQGTNDEAPSANASEFSQE